MISGRRRVSLSLLAFFTLLSSTSLTPPTHVYASDAPNADMSSDEWKQILTNGRGQDACTLQEWMGGSGCQHNQGGNTRRALAGRDDELSPSACKCTVPYFNILCGCRLSKGESLESINSINYTQWKLNCESQGFFFNKSMLWIDDQGQDIPDWAYAGPNGLFFDSTRVQRIALAPQRWTLLQIVTPVIVGTTVLFFAGIIFIYRWRLSRRPKDKSQPNLTFLNSALKLLKSRKRNVRRTGRNEEWIIDEGEEHVINENENDTESFFMVPNVHSLVDSPVEAEISYWSPTTASFNSPPVQRSSYSFKPRQPSRLGPGGVDVQMPYRSTMRNIGDRVRNLMPWVSRPHPVTNIRPGSRYRIDGDQSTIGSKTRSNTLSTLTTTRKNSERYQAIVEADEEIDVVRTGRTRGPKSTITDGDREAVAESVILIGDRDFTLESGSTGQHPTPVRASARAAAAAVDYARGRGLGAVKSPESARLNFQVEPPSPTLESIPIQSPRNMPVSPGAPPLLPPPPQERPPPPPITQRSTPRRTPSPHLRISTHFDDIPTLASSRNPSNSNLNSQTNRNIGVSAGNIHPALRLSPASENKHQRDPSGSGSGTNALSYASLPGPGSHIRSESGGNNNNNEYLTTGADLDRETSHSSRRRSGSGSRPLPPHPPSGLAPAAAPELSHQTSETSIGQFSILRTPNASITDRRRLSGGDAQQTSSDFDPYITQGLPRPTVMPLQPNRRRGAYSNNNTVYINPHQRSVSNASLPRTPGDPEGQPQRGWSADDDVDRTSLLIEQMPMEVDNAMSGVYIATPRDVRAMGGPGMGHWRNLSDDSFATAASDIGSAELNGGRRGAGVRNSFNSGLEPNSPTLSMLERDPRVQQAFGASYAGRESVSGSSGWDASTQASHGPNDALSPPTDPLPPVPNSNPRLFATTNASTPNIRTHGHTHSHSFSSNSIISTPSRSLTPNPGTGHTRLGSDSSINARSLRTSRSREEILNPARNDPVRLFPASVRAAGYTTGLSPEAGPVPTRTPRPNENGNGNVSANNNGNGRVGDNHGGSSTNTGGGGGSNGNGGGGGRRGPNGIPLSGSGPMAGLVERDRTQVRGGTWETDSSGVQSILEQVQQLPETYAPVRGGTPNLNSGTRRTP